MFFFLQRFFGILVLWGIVVGNCSAANEMHEIVFEFKDGISQRYTVVASADEARYFVSDCVAAEKVIIDGKEDIAAPMDTAMKTLLINVLNANSTKVLKTLEEIQESEIQEEARGLISLITWVGYQEFSSVSPNTSGICLNLLNKFASSNFEKARMLLVSQSNANYMPNEQADWRVIGEAVHLLQNEKNGHINEAVTLLGLLKATGRYTALLGK